MGDEAASEKRMRLRYAGTCRVCSAELAAKVEAIYERDTRSVRCLHTPSRRTAPTRISRFHP